MIGLGTLSVSGIDDHSRLIVCAVVVVAATARRVCRAVAAALGRHGVPRADDVTSTTNRRLHDDSGLECRDGMYGLDHTICDLYASILGGRERRDEGQLGGSRVVSPLTFRNDSRTCSNYSGMWLGRASARTRNGDVWVEVGARGEFSHPVG